MTAEHRSCAFCDRPARWMYCIGCNAGMTLYCDACIIERLGEVPEGAMRYAGTAKANEYIDRFNAITAEGYPPEEDTHE